MSRGWSLSRLYSAAGFVRAELLPGLTALSLLAAFSTGAAAQQTSVQGLVTSSRAGSPLEAVEIELNAGAGRRYIAHTDRNGFYQIGGVEPGTYLLRARLVGHVQREQSVLLRRGEHLTVNLRLEPDAVALRGVVVSPNHGAAVVEMGRQRIVPSDLHVVPVPAGSGDLASYLQTLPAVVTTGDRGGQLFVRGGTPAENLVLVDGIPIYQPFHILGFFSPFPEDLISSVDFYAGGFGARYSGRTSSVLDVALRDGDPNRIRASGSASPFLAEAVVEGPVAPGISWMGSVRHSLIEPASETLLGTREPLLFDSQLFKITVADGANLRCSVLGLHTADRGQTDPERPDSHVSWTNKAGGARCITQFDRVLRLVEVDFTGSSFENAAISHGSSDFTSKVWRMENDLHLTSLLGPIPLYAGYHLYIELTDADLEELFGSHQDDGDILGTDAYLEADVPLGRRAQIRPGLVLAGSPEIGLEPRIRLSWEPFGTGRGELHGAFGRYRQELVGTSDIRDVSSVFTAWMPAPGGTPLDALHFILGWQQALGVSVGDNVSLSSEIMSHL